MKNNNFLNLILFSLTTTPIHAQILSAGIVSYLTAAARPVAAQTVSVQAVAGPTIVPNNPGCSGVNQTNSTCTLCLGHCAQAIAICALACAQNILACPVRPAFLRLDRELG